MSRRRKFMFPILMTTGVLGGGGVPYLIRGLFGTDQAAPMPAEFAIDIGKLVKVADTNNAGRISGGKFIVQATAANNFIDPGYKFLRDDDSGLPLESGMMTKMDFSPKLSTTRPWMWGVWNTLTPSALTLRGFYGASDASLYFANLSAYAAIVVGTWANSDYIGAVVYHAPGYSAYIQGGAYAEWTLVWNDASLTATQLVPGMAGIGVTNTEYDDLECKRLGGVFRQSHGYTTVNTTAVADTEYSASDSDVIADVVITAPGTLSGSAGFKYRKTDDNNYHQVYFDSSGNLIANKVVAGTPTDYSSPVSVASAITTSATRTLRIQARGSTIRVYTHNGSAWTTQATISDSFNTEYDTIQPYQTGGWTLGALVVRPMTSPFFSSLGSVPSVGTGPSLSQLLTLFTGSQSNVALHRAGTNEYYMCQQLDATRYWCLELVHEPTSASGHNNWLIGDVYIRTWNGSAWSVETTLLDGGSAHEYAYLILPDGASNNTFVGATHQYDDVTSITFEIDSSPVTPTVGQTLFGSELVITTAHNLYHPDTSTTVICEIALTYIMTPDTGLTIAHTDTWQVDGDVTTAYVAMLPSNETLDKGSNVEDALDYSLALNDGVLHANQISQAAYMWDANGNYAYLLYMADSTSVNGWVDTGALKLYIQDRNGGGGLNKIYLPRVSTVTAFATDEVWSSSVNYRCQRFADADASLARS